MKKIVVFSGGTGSIALQRGFAELYGQDRLRLDVVVNAYDNGKSTGACRRIMGGKILGPSDVRKNQMLHFELNFAEELKDPESWASRMAELFEARYSADSSEAYYDLAKKKLVEFADVLGDVNVARCRELVEYFFHETGGVWRTSVEKESFHDFALSNIFYASSAAMHGNSLSAAADEMAAMLGIENRVHLISDKNLYLAAETVSGRIVDDEGEIVAWDNAEDPFVRAILRDEGGREYIPFVGEGSADTEKIRRMTEDADVIIFSSGTQWASLIPTYMHRDFGEMIRRSKAKKYLVMNTTEDHDSYGVGVEDFCRIWKNFLPLEQITLVVNSNAVPALDHAPEGYRAIVQELGEKGSKKHDPKKLVGSIMQDYYGEVVQKKNVFFDLDGTLWDERGTEADKVVGRDNLRLMCGVILSGNTVSHIRQVLTENAPVGKKVEVYADYGNTHLAAGSEMADKLTEVYDLPDTLVGRLSCLWGNGVNVSRRGGAVITVKPIENRATVIEQISSLLAGWGIEAVALEAGRTSIDIMRKNYGKPVMLRAILAQQGIPESDVVFVGNELNKGSEEGIVAMGLSCLPVADVQETNTFLRTKAWVEAKE